MSQTGTAATATAPGKLLLVGEYAVLDGAAAISAAVDLRARASVEPATGSMSELRISNSATTYKFTTAADGAVHWDTEPGERGAILEAVVATLAAAELVVAEPITVELCTRSFFTASPGGAEQKIGIGSSAALTVALTAAMQSFCGVTPDFSAALRAHRNFQSGAGSGVDVATSWYGGVISMRPAGQADGSPLIEHLEWPKHLYIAPVWTGVAASTTSLLDRLEEFRQHSGQRYAECQKLLAAAAQPAQDSWRAGDTDRILGAIIEFGGALAVLDAAAGIGIWSEAHVQLNALAADCGVIYKPSGAGGGDFGLGFSGDQQLLQNFVRQAEQFIGTQDHALRWSETGLECATASR